MTASEKAAVKSAQKASFGKVFAVQIAAYVVLVVLALIPGISYGIDNVERVEIVKGAASTLYGSSAVGGVINIITRDSEPLPPGGKPRRRQKIDDRYDHAQPGRRNIVCSAVYAFHGH